MTKMQALSRDQYQRTVFFSRIDQMNMAKEVQAMENEGAASF